MSELRRLWVERAIYEDPGALERWLAEQGLSRFFIEIAHDDDRYLIDVHTLQEVPATALIPSAASSKNCNDLNCTLCTPAREPVTVLDHAPETGYRWEWSESVGDASAATTDVRSFPEAGTVNWLPLRGPDDTDPVPRYREPFPWAGLGWWFVTFLLALIGGFILVRGWYMQYGCPFLPDHGLLSACRALVIHMGKG